MKYKKTTADRKWECFRDEVANWSQERSKQLAKERKEKLNSLIKQYDTQKQTIMDKGDIGGLERCKQYENEINELIKLKTQSAAFRSRTRYISEYERNSKFFFSLEKSNYNKKTMRKVYTEEGTLTTNPKEILNVQRQFYSKLYTSDTNVKFNLENDPRFPELNIEEKELCNQEISLQELDEAVRSLKKNKCCGSDGFSAEFYQFFWHKIRSMYFEAINYTKKVGVLHKAARRGVIILIPKKATLKK